MMDKTKDQIDKEATELITLLDRYLLLRGELSTWPDNVSSSASAVIATDSTFTARDDVPASLQIYPKVDLGSQLQNLQLERAELGRLTAHIAAICLDSGIVIKAKEMLASAYAAVPRDHADDAFSKRGLPEMLALLRTVQQRAVIEAETFALIAVNGAMSDGSPERMEVYHLPRGASWYEAQQTLTDTTIGWQAREAGYPYGYGLKDGKWIYQVAKGSSLESTKYDLLTTEQYLAMRKRIEEEGVKVMVWHVSRPYTCCRSVAAYTMQELVLKAAHEAEETFEAERDTRCEDPSDEPLDEHGKPIFAPTLDIAQWASPK